MDMERGDGYCSGTFRSVKTRHSIPPQSIGFRRLDDPGIAGGYLKFGISETYV